MQGEAEQKAFFKKCLEKLLDLKTLRIVGCQRSGQAIKDYRLPRYFEYRISLLEYVVLRRPELMDTLSVLSCVQCCEGLRIGYTSSEAAYRMRCVQGQENAHQNPDDLPWTTYHYLHDVGVYLYVRQGMKMKELPWWNEEKVVKLFPVNEYLEHVMDGMCVEDVERFKSYVSGMSGWREELEGEIQSDSGLGRSSSM
jgi:hypothetical protein